jgi:hypothetical protein
VFSKTQKSGKRERLSMQSVEPVLNIAAGDIKKVSSVVAKQSYQYSSKEARRS